MTSSSPSSTTAPVATEAAPFPDDDPRALFGRGVALATAVLDRVEPAHLDRPTPCDEMDVARLRRHLVMVLRRVACAGRGEDWMTWPEEPTADDLPDADVAGAWRAAAHEVQAAWTDDAVLDRPTGLPWGTFSGAETLAVYLNEVTVHTWDLARATDQEPLWDPAVLALADAAIHAQLPMADRAPMWEGAKAGLPADYPWEDPFGPAVAVPDDAPAIDRLVAWNGRTP